MTLLLVVSRFPEFDLRAGELQAAPCPGARSGAAELLDDLNRALPGDGARAFRGEVRGGLCKRAYAGRQGVRDKQKGGKCMVTGVEGGAWWPVSTAREKATGEAPSSLGARPGPSFYQLIATQLRYQNPLEPLSESDFMTQVTQLAILDELKQIRSLMEQVAGKDGSVLP